jgi:hypothetical protein
MLTASFWGAALERAVKTFAQILLSLLVVGDYALNAFTFDWVPALGIAGGGFVISLLTSIVSAPISPAGTPSLVGEPPYTR